MVPNVVDSIFWGVISGILTAVALGGISVIFRQVLIPWYQAITYSGLNISGEWHGIDPSMTQEIQLNIVQKARKLKGTAIFIHADEDDPSEREYESSRAFEIEGFTQDRFVLLTLRHVSNSRLGINNYLLEVIGDGRKMAGVFSFFSVNTSQIASSHQILYREKSFAAKLAKQAKEDLARRRRELLEELRETERQEESVVVDYDPSLFEGDAPDNRQRGQDD